MKVVHLVITALPLIWYITATYLRFGHGGKVIAGDYLGDKSDTKGYMPATGNFLKFSILIIWSIIGLLCCCFGIFS